MSMVLEPLEEGGIQVYDHLLPIPFRSQRLHVAAYNEPERACGMTCVWMVLAALCGTENVLDLDELIALGKERGGLVEGVGWAHEFLLHTIRLYGINGMRYDKKNSPPSPDEMPDIFGKIIDGGNPILVSMRRGSGGHIVLLTGTRRDENGFLTGFFHHDPDVDRVSMGEHKFISLDEFGKCWRQLAIMPEKPVGWSKEKIISRYPTVYLK